MGWVVHGKYFREFLHFYNKAIKKLDPLILIINCNRIIQGYYLKPSTAPLHVLLLSDCDCFFSHFVNKMMVLNFKSSSGSSACNNGARCPESFTSWLHDLTAVKGKMKPHHAHGDHTVSSSFCPVWDSHKHWSIIASLIAHWGNPTLNMLL